MRKTPALDTQLKVAAACGLSPSTISRILNGSVAAHVEVLDAIAKAFGRQPADLLRSAADTSLRYDVARYAQLPDAQKDRVEKFIARVLTDQEGSTFVSSPLKSTDIG